MVPRPATTTPTGTTETVTFTPVGHGTWVLTTTYTGGLPTGAALTNLTEAPR